METKTESGSSWHDRLQEKGRSYMKTIYGHIYTIQKQFLVDLVPSLSSSPSSSSSHLAVKETHKHVYQQLQKRDPPPWENPFQEAQSYKDLPSHRHLLPCLCVYEDESYQYMVFPFCYGGDLVHYMEDYFGRGYITLPPRQLLSLFQQVVFAVQHLHQHGFLHLDLSLENCLLQHKDDPQRPPHLYLADLGQAQNLKDCSRVIVTGRRSPPGKIFYMAPETLRDSSPLISTTADCWQLGVFLYVLLTFEYPFSKRQVKKKEWKAWQEAWKKKTRAHEMHPQVSSLLAGLLEEDPHKRMTLKQVQAHPWFVQSSVVVE